MNLVLESVGDVVREAADVTIDDAAIQRWADAVTRKDLRPACHELLAHLPGSHAKLANIVLLIDALNFCFWSSNPIKIEWRGRTYERFNAMFVSLMLAARYDPRWFDAAFWADVPSDELRPVLSGRGELLLMDERERIVRETGQVLLERFDGQFLNAIESVNEHAWPLAVLLMTNCDSFRAVGSYQGRPVYFMKRAQICALDVSVAFHTHELAPLHGLELLTAFADYRVPQSLRHLGIMRLSPELEKTVDSDIELQANSEQEVEIRAATIVAIDRMAKALLQANKAAAAWEIDWYLWELAHRDEIKAKHHRTRTVYY